MSNQPDIATDLDEPSDDAGGTIRIPGENGELVIFGRVLMIERLPDRKSWAGASTSSSMIRGAVCATATGRSHHTTLLACTHS